MIILGTVLLVLVVLVILGTVFSNGGALPDLTVLGLSVSHVSAGGLFLGGVISGVIGMLGLFLLLGGGARRRHKTVARKREVKSVRGQADTLEQENARLRDELDGKSTVISDEPGGLRR